MATPFPTLPTIRRPWGALPSIVDMHRQMNRVFDDLFFNGGALLASPFGMAAGGGSPLLDVEDKDDEVCIHASVPGVAADDVDLRLEGDTLTLSAQRSQASDDDAPRSPSQLIERSLARFERAVRLPFTPDPDRVSAEFANGVLTVHVPRDVEPPPSSRRIEVRQAQDSSPAPAQPVSSVPSAIEASPLQDTQPAHEPHSFAEASQAWDQEEAARTHAGEDDASQGLS